jgi:uncharacterized membrane protein
MFLLQTIVGLVLIAIIDGSYLTLNKHFYKPIMGSKTSIKYGILAWLSIVLGIQLIVLSRPDLNASNVFYHGAILGASMYALYNFTNAFMYPDKWSNMIILGDTAWGTVLTGSMSWILFRSKKMLA